MAIYTVAWPDEDGFVTYLVGDIEYTLKLKSSDEFERINEMLSSSDLNVGEENVKARVIELIGSALALVNDDNADCPK